MTALKPQTQAATCFSSRPFDQMQLEGLTGPVEEKCHNGVYGVSTATKKSDKNLKPAGFVILLLRGLAAPPTHTHPSLTGAACRLETCCWYSPATGDLPAIRRIT